MARHQGGSDETGETPLCFPGSERAKAAMPSSSDGVVCGRCCSRGRRLRLLPCALRCLLSIKGGRVACRPAGRAPEHFPEAPPLSRRGAPVSARLSGICKVKLFDSTFVPRPVHQALRTAISMFATVLGPVVQW